MNHHSTPLNPLANNKLPAGAIWLGHWILFGAACNVAGWTLSAIHQLNPLGLIIAIPLFWFIIAKLIGLPIPSLPSRGGLKQLRNRFSSLFPFLFLLLALLSLIGGILYPPNNFDALIYRMPRVCHWLMEERWEWIPTIKNNLNTRSAGYEWWSAPMFAILRTDRLLFLVNWISFLFLPGLFFNLLRQFGVCRRASLVWMWILPAGYCFVLQAASVGNDMLAALFALAAFDFGFRWKRGAGYPAFALALAACAMMTAIKPTTLPLLLPFGVLFFGMWKPAIAKPLASAGLVILFALASFLPTALINVRQCGDWTGAAAEDMKLGRVEPLVGISTNSLNTVLQNSLPPIFPVANLWNKMIHSLVPDEWIEANLRSFEEKGARFSASDFQGEESAGMGFGITWLLVISTIMAFGLKAPGRPDESENARRQRKVRNIAAITFSIALLAYFSRAGMTTVARHIAPFYPFFLVLIISLGNPGQVVKSRIWRWAALFAVSSAVIMVIITPSRPLWPAKAILSRIDGNSHPILKRAKTGYLVYGNRADGIGPVREALPPDVETVGLLSHASGAELPLWKPYMERRVRHVLHGETIATLREEGIPYLVLNTENFEKARGMPADDWVRKDGGIVKKRVTLHLLAQKQPFEWWLVEIPPTFP